MLFDANPMMIIGYHKPTAPAYDDYVFDILETILTTGRTSRLYNLLSDGNGSRGKCERLNGVPRQDIRIFLRYLPEPVILINKELEEVILREIRKN